MYLAIPADAVVAFGLGRLLFLAAWVEARVRIYGRFQFWESWALFESNVEEHFPVETLLFVNGHRPISLSIVQKNP